MADNEKTDVALRPPFAARPIPPKPTSLTRSLSQSNSSVPNSDASQQPTLDTASNLPLTALDSLPTIAGRNNNCYLANDDIKKFVSYDLNLSRLNRIHGSLWMAGRPMRARPLHRYKMEGYEVVYAQNHDLHLLKFSNKLMLKPLPEWMLDHDFWEEWICDDEKLHKSACGLLLSYVWLVTTPLDHKQAHDLHLLPSFVTWHWWKEFVTDYVQNVEINVLDQVNKRYHFGDLRLGRVNSIYRVRFAHTHFVRGYLYGYNRYVAFFQRKFSWVLIVFVFFSLVLSAMQVGAGVDPLQKNETFLRASYGFVVFSIVSVAAVLALITLIFCVIFFFNMGSAITHAKRVRREREKKAQERASNKKDA